MGSRLSLDKLPSLEEYTPVKLYTLVHPITVKQLMRTSISIVQSGISCRSNYGSHQRNCGIHSIIHHICSKLALKEPADLLSLSDCPGFESLSMTCLSLSISLINSSNRV